MILGALQNVERKNHNFSVVAKNHHLFLPCNSLQNQDPDPDKRIGTESREKKRIRKRPFFGLDDLSKPNCGHFSSNQIFFLYLERNLGLIPTHMYSSSFLLNKFTDPQHNNSFYELRLPNVYYYIILYNNNILFTSYLISKVCSVPLSLQVKFCTISLVHFAVIRLVLHN